MLEIVFIFWFSQSPDGDLVDCVLSHLQPAFDHPQLIGQKPLVSTISLSLFLSLSLTLRFLHCRNHPRGRKGSNKKIQKRRVYSCGLYQESLVQRELFPLGERRSRTFSEQAPSSDSERSPWLLTCAVTTPAADTR